MRAWGGFVGFVVSAASGCVVVLIVLFWWLF